MTVHQVPAPSDVFYHFVGAVDHTLTEVALRYGTSAQAIYRYNREHHPDRAVFTSMHAFLTAIDGGTAFQLPIPRDERTAGWERVSCEGQSLQGFCDVQNQRAERRLQAHVSPLLLWNYALNAEARTRVLQSADSPATARQWDSHPGSAMVPAGVAFHVPYTRPLEGPPVNTTTALPVAMVPPPRWLAEFDNVVGNLRFQVDALAGVNRQIGTLHGECLRTHSYVAFLRSYLTILRDNTVATGAASEWWTRVGPLLTTLDQQSEQHLSLAGVRLMRPDYFTRRTRLAQQVAAVLTNARFDERLHALQQSFQSLRDGLTILNRAYATLASAVDALAECGDESLESLVSRLQSGLSSLPDASGRARAEGHAVVTAVRFLTRPVERNRPAATAPDYDSDARAALGLFSTVVGSTVGNTPGPASIVVAAAQVHVLGTVLNARTRTFQVADNWIEGLIRFYGPSSDDAEFFRAAVRRLHRGEVLGARRLGRITEGTQRLTGRVTQGPVWTALILLCNILSFYAMTSDESREASLTDWLNLTSTTIATGLTTTQLITQLISSLDGTSPAARFLAGAGSHLGNFTAILGLFSALITAVSAQLSRRDGNPNPASNTELISAWGQVLGSALLVYSVLGRAFWLQGVAVIISLVSAIIGNWGTLSTGAARRFAMQILQTYADGSGHERGQLDRMNLGDTGDHNGAPHPASVFWMIGRQRSTLITAWEALKTELETGWSIQEQFHSCAVAPGGRTIRDRLRYQLNLSESTIEAITTAR